MRRFPPILLILALASALVGVPALLVADRGAAQNPRDDRARTAVTETPISFAVRNVNRSAVACATDGRAYEIRGTLIGPQAALSSPRVRAGTLYLHGLGFGKFFWNFDPVPTYDYAQRLARDGHVSVVVDRLGYDDSGHPVGMDSCLGGQADIANQIVNQLRAGSYTAGGDRPTPALARVVLAGHSVGGLLAQLTAHSFDNVDGLMVFAYSDRVASPAARAALGRVARVCASGGARAEGQPGPMGYASLSPTPLAARQALFANDERIVSTAALALANLNPCGDTGSYMAAVAANIEGVPSIDVPTLLVFGRQDALFPPPAGANQRALLSGAEDVTLVQVRGGHSLTLQRSAPRVRAAASEWLDEHGFSGRG